MSIRVTVDESGATRQKGKAAMAMSKGDVTEAKARVEKFDAVKELKIGRDQTAEVPKWERYLAGSEAATGGSYGAALEAHPGPAWAGFAREVFAKLYDGHEPKTLPAEARPHGATWVEKMHDAAESLPEFKALTARARRDAWACGVAAGEALKIIAENVQPPKEDPQAIQDEIDFVKSLMEGGKTNPQHLKRLASLGRQLQGAQEGVARATQVLGAKSASLRSQMRGAAMKAQEALDEMDAATSALGAGQGTGIASRSSAPPHVLKNELLKNKKLRRIAALAGRMKTAAINKQRTKARPGQEELCDVTIGGDLRRLVPSELGNLADEDTEALLYRRLMESAAMSYELRGKERKSEGPIVVAVDESGSMSGAPDEWAKAVVFGLLEIAARQNRPLYLIHFDYQVTRIDAFPDARAIDIKAIADAVTYFTGGGTSIGAALENAQMVMQANEGPWSRADVIVITDGESGDYDRQQAAVDAIKKRGGHLYVVGIGITPHGVLADEADESVVISSDDIKIGDAAKVSAVFTM